MAPASFAFDGDTNPDFYAGTTAHTEFDHNPYIAVDLTRRYQVSYVLVTNTDSGYSRKYDMSGISWSPGQNGN